MKLYIYNTTTNEVIAVIEGVNNQECERIANEAGYFGDDEIGATYSPAFGFTDGLTN